MPVDHADGPRSFRDLVLDVSRLLLLSGDKIGGAQQGPHLCKGWRFSYSRAVSLVILCQGAPFLLIFGASIDVTQREFYATPGGESIASERRVEIHRGRAASFCIPTGAVLK